MEETTRSPRRVPIVLALILLAFPTYFIVGLLLSSKSSRETESVSGHNETDSLPVEQSVTNAVNTPTQGGSAEQRFLDKASQYSSEEKYRSALIEYRNVLQKNPEHVKALFGASVCLRNLNDIPEAIRKLEKAFELAPGDYDVNVLLADCYNRINNDDLAKEHIDRALSVDDANAEVFLLAGIINEKMDLLDEAELCLARALELNPKLTAARTCSARLLRRRGERDKAREVIEKVLETNPAQFDARLEQLLLQQGVVERTVLSRQYEELITEFPRARILILTQQMRSLLLAGQIDDALSGAMKILRDKPSHLIANRVAASIFMRQKLYVLAIKHCNTIIQNHQDAAGAYTILSRAYRESGDIQNALKAADDGLRACGPHFQLTMARAGILVADGRKEDAIAAFHAAARLGTNSPIPFASIGNLHRSDGELDDAVAAYDKALQINPKAPVAANNLAMVLLAMGKEFQRALSLAEDLGKRFPRNGAVLDTLAWAYFKTGKVSEAYDKLKVAEMLSPNSPGIMYHMGAVLSRQKKKQEAIEYLERSLKSPREFFESEDARLLLGSLRK